MLSLGDERGEQEAKFKMHLKILKQNVKTFQVTDDHDGWSTIKFHLTAEFANGQKILEECMEKIGLEPIVEQDSYHALETVIQQRLRR